MAGGPIVCVTVSVDASHWCRHTNNYNRCEVWSNFEIADLDLWRSEVYAEYFDFLDASGGFYYEAGAANSFFFVFAKIGLFSAGETQ